MMFFLMLFLCLSAVNNFNLKFHGWERTNGILVLVNVSLQKLNIKLK